MLILNTLPVFGLYGAIVVAASQGTYVYNALPDSCNVSVLLILGAVHLIFR